MISVVFRVGACFQNESGFVAFQFANTLFCNSFGASSAVNLVWHWCQNFEGCWFATWLRSVFGAEGEDQASSHCWCPRACSTEAQTGWFPAKDLWACVCSGCPWFYAPPSICCWVHSLLFFSPLLSLKLNEGKSKSDSLTRYWTVILCCLNGV